MVGEKTRRDFHWASLSSDLDEAKRHAGQKGISIADTLCSKQRHRFPRDYPGTVEWLKRRSVDIGRARRSFITGKNCSTLSAREGNPRVRVVAPPRVSRTKESDEKRHRRPRMVRMVPGK